MTTIAAIKKVLLIEDNLMHQKIASRAMQQEEINIDLSIIENADKAILFLKSVISKKGFHYSELPDLILLDLKMPGKDGIEVLKMLKNEEKLKFIPTIILTSSELEKDVDDSYFFGANAYILKPQNANDFIKMIKSITEFWFNFNILPSKSYSNFQ